MNTKSLFSIFFLSLLTACGGGPNPDRDALNRIPATQNVSGAKFTLLSSPDLLTFGDGTLSGTGLVRFANDLGAVETAFHYALTFSLQDASELTFISHANSSLQNGVELKFKRSGNALSVFVTAAGSTDDWSSFFTTVDASTEIKINLDVHNNEAITHLLFWNDAVSTTATTLDSAEDVDGAPGKGHGQNWGLRLSNADVKSIVVGEARHAH